ncbi:MAG TPA: NAD-dependent epimerase/dehydratase family protein, partial [Acidimicrobiia bacterium]|nr:NAD-dependent epimerase/dehydratase family protein [Acidimicrobiia bacterium]
LQRQCDLFRFDPARVHSVTGDILDRDSVVAALDGADACIHAAAFTTLTPEEMPKALGVNAPGSRIVLDAALDHGCDPVISVSSMSVVFPPSGDHLSADDPVHTGGAPYNASKADAELHARSLQDAGAPVVTVYPGGVMGPLDLGVNVVEAMWTTILASEYLMLAETGGYLAADVRDTADAMAALLQPGRGPCRYMMGGRFIGWEECAGVVDKVTGRERARVLQTREELEQQIDPEAVAIMLGIVPSDDRAMQRDTGVHWRPFPETLENLVRWLLESGRLDPQWAPALA